MSPGTKLPKQRTEQGRLPRLFSLVRSQGQIHHAGGRQGEDRHDPRDRQSHARLLRFRLRILGLVLGCLRHREGEAIDQLGMEACSSTATPCRLPTRGLRRRHSSVHGAQLPRVWRGLGNSRPYPTSVPRCPLAGSGSPHAPRPPDRRPLCRRAALETETTRPSWRPCRSHAGRTGRHAGRTRARSVRPTESRQTAAPCGPETHRRLAENRRCLAAANVYVRDHEKPSLALFAGSVAKEGFIIIAKRGQNLKHHLDWPEILKNSRPSQWETCAHVHRRQCHSVEIEFQTIPHRVDPFSCMAGSLEH